jgi:uncharacterized protein (TIGR03435 family)
MVSRIAVLILASGLQSRAQAPVFEVASVKPAAPVAVGYGTRSAAGGDPSRVTYTHASFVLLLTRAYQVMPYQITGPSWLETESYDIVAKAPDNTRREQIPRMLQALLAERFKLRVHRETRILPVYALLVGKNGAKMQRVEADASEPHMGFGDGLEGKKTSMAFFVSILSSYMDRPVLDLTELQGAYDFKLDVSVQELVRMKSGVPTAPAPDSVAKPSIFTAIEQIGLKFEARKAPIEMVVVDSAERIPTEN